MESLSPTLNNIRQLGQGLFNGQMVGQRIKALNNIDAGATDARPRLFQRITSLATTLIIASTHIPALKALSNSTWTNIGLSAIASWCLTKAELNNSIKISPKTVTNIIHVLNIAAITFSALSNLPLAIGIVAITVLYTLNEYKPNLIPQALKNKMALITNILNICYFPSTIVRLLIAGATTLELIENKIIPTPNAMANNASNIQDIPYQPDDGQQIFVVDHNHVHVNPFPAKAIPNAQELDSIFDQIQTFYTTSIGQLEIENKHYSKEILPKLNDDPRFKRGYLAEEDRDLSTAELQARKDLLEKFSINWFKEDYIPTTLNLLKGKIKGMQPILSGGFDTTATRQKMYYVIDMLNSSANEENKQTFCQALTGFLIRSGDYCAAGVDVAAAESLETAIGVLADTKSDPIKRQILHGLSEIRVNRIFGLLQTTFDAFGQDVFKNSSLSIHNYLQLLQYMPDFAGYRLEATKADMGATQQALAKANEHLLNCGLKGALSGFARTGGQDRPLINQPKVHYVTHKPFNRDHINVFALQTYLSLINEINRITESLTPDLHLDTNNLFKGIKSFCYSIFKAIETVVFLFTDYYNQKAVSSTSSKILEEALNSIKSNIKSAIPKETSVCGIFEPIFCSLMHTILDIFNLSVTLIAKGINQITPLNSLLDKYAETIRPKLYGLESFEQSEYLDKKAEPLFRRKVSTGIEPQPEIQWQDIQFQGDYSNPEALIQWVKNEGFPGGAITDAKVCAWLEQHLDDIVEGKGDIDNQTKHSYQGHILFTKQEMPGSNIAAIYEANDSAYALMLEQMGILKQQES